MTKPGVLMKHVFIHDGNCSSGFAERNDSAGIINLQSFDPLHELGKIKKY